MDETYSFKRYSEEELILVPVQIGETMYKFVLDTGATHTYIDFGILIGMGFRLDQTLGLTEVATANGIFMANIFTAPVISFLNHSLENHLVTSFVFDDIESEFKGVLGLDFFEGTELCINLKTNTLTLK